MSDDEGPIRLSKLLSRAGVASRRRADELIAAGRVKVDGEIVDQLGVRVDPETVVVHVDGRRVQLRDDVVYLMLNKPAGVLSTMVDDRGRPSLAPYARPWTADGVRLFHVGRLDADTEGLLLLTNDGALAHRLAHPSFGVRKSYVATVPGPIPRDLGRRLRAGVRIPPLPDGEQNERPVQVDSFRVLDQHGAEAMLEVVLHEGRKRVVRRLLAEVGHPVRRLVRTRYADVRLGDLRPGTVRPLTPDEVATLFAAVEAPPVGPLP